MTWIKCKNPAGAAQVRLGAFRHRRRRDHAAQGRFDLAVWKPGYESPTRPVAISAEIAVAALPEDDPDAAWKM